MQMFLQNQFGFIEICHIFTEIKITQKTYPGLSFFLDGASSLAKQSNNFLFQ